MTTENCSIQCCGANLKVDLPSQTTTSTAVPPLLLVLNDSESANGNQEEEEDEVTKSTKISSGSLDEIILQSQSVMPNGLVLTVDEHLGGAGPKKKARKKKKRSKNKTTDTLTENSSSIPNQSEDSTLEPILLLDSQKVQLDGGNNVGRQPLLLNDGGVIATKKQQEMDRIEQIYTSLDRVHLRQGTKNEGAINNNNLNSSNGNISYKQYESEAQMPMVMRIIQKDLSEPYSIYTYRYFIHNWPRLCFLAMDGEACVGAIVCKLDVHRKVIQRGYIAMLAVDEKYRKVGIGSTLVCMAIKQMIAGDADEVVLETEVTNKPALRLYEALGFVRDKRLFRYYLNGVDALRLKLWLR